MIPGSRATGYPAIAALLREQIGRGELRPGEQLPRIEALARRHGTTAITVRRALRQLEEEGLIRVQHGVGTFVADWARDYDLLSLPSFTAEMAARRLQVETALRERLLETRCAAAAEALGLEPEAPLAMLARARRVEGLPVAYQRSYFPAALRPVVEAYTPERSLYELLRDHTGRSPVAASERLEAVLLEAAAAAELGSAAGAPGWRSLRTTLDARGEALVYDEAYFAAERVALAVERRAGQISLDYALSL